MSSLELLYPAKSATGIFFGNHDVTCRCVRSCCGIQREERRCITARNRVFSSYIGVKEAGLSKWEVQIGDWIMEQLAPLAAQSLLALGSFASFGSFTLLVCARQSEQRQASSKIDRCYACHYVRQEKKHENDTPLHTTCSYVVCSSQLTGLIVQIWMARRSIGPSGTDLATSLAWWHSCTTPTLLNAILNVQLTKYVLCISS